MAEENWMGTERTIRLLRAKAAELEHVVGVEMARENKVDPHDMVFHVYHLTVDAMAAIALIAQLLADDMAHTEQAIQSLATVVEVLVTGTVDEPSGDG